jgi:aminoglycoside phosphotransferase (APT) family kinase protein
LPPHLIAQVERYLARWGPFDSVFTHSDIVVNHVFVENGRLASVIDWGDGMVADRHYELPQVHLNLFDCDKALLKVFLKTSRWPMASDYVHKAMGMTLLRQAIGLEQHHSMDVFYRLPAKLPLQDIPSLENLATALFAV